MDSGYLYYIILYGLLLVVSDDNNNNNNNINNNNNCMCMSQAMLVGCSVDLSEGLTRAQP